MEVMTKNMLLSRNFLVTYRTFEIGSLQEMIRSAYEGRDQQWRTQLVQLLNKFLEDVRTETVKQKDMLSSRVSQYCLLILDTIFFNLFTKQKKEERQIFNASIYEGSQLSMASAYSKLQNNSDVSNATIACGYGGMNAAGGASAAAANTQFVDNFRSFFGTFIQNTEFFENVAELFKSNRPISEIKSALKSLFQTLSYIAEKDSFNANLLATQWDPLLQFTQAGNNNNNNNQNSPNTQIVSNVEIDDVNAILFGNKLDKIVRVLNSKNFIGSQIEVHFAIGRIYFAAHSKSRSNFNRSHFKHVKNSGKNMLYNIMRHYVMNSSSPERLRTQICSGNDTEMFPIPAFILNYLQLLFMPLYNQFQELFDKHVMQYFVRDAPSTDAFYLAIFSPTIQYIIPFLENLPSEFCNFFTQFYQIITENHDLFTDKMNDLFPVKQLFVNRFFLNPNLRQVSLPISAHNKDDYIEALNLFSKLFYINTKDDRTSSSNHIFYKLNNVISECFQKLVSHYHVQQGHTDIYNLYIVGPMLKNDYAFISQLTKLISFSELEQKEYQLVKFKQGFGQKKRADAKQPMDIIREIATPGNDHHLSKMASNHSTGSEFFHNKNAAPNMNINTNTGQANNNYNPTGYNNNNNNNNMNPYGNNNLSRLPSEILPNNLKMNTQQYPSFKSQTQQSLSQQWSVNNNNNNQVSSPEENVGSQQYSTMRFQQGNYRGSTSGTGAYDFSDQQQYQNEEESERFLREQLELINLKKRKLEEEQEIVERQQNRLVQERSGKTQEVQKISNFFSNHHNGNVAAQARLIQEKLALEYERKYTEQLETVIQHKKQNVIQDEAKEELKDEIVMLHERNQFLKMIMKNKYPGSADYIESLDNKENLQDWKKRYELQQAQQERREKRKEKQEKDNDEFYIYQNKITTALQKLEDLDLKLEVHQKLTKEIS